MIFRALLMNFRHLLFWLNDQGTYRHTLGGLCVILATWFAFLDQRTLCWSIAMEHFCLSVSVFFSQTTAGHQCPWISCFINALCH